MARKVLEAQDRWDAYDAAYECIAVVDDHLHNKTPLSDPIWISWMWAVNVFELEEASPEAAQGVLRGMATEWLLRPAEPDLVFVQRGAAHSKAAIIEVTNPGLSDSFEHAAGDSRPFACLTAHPSGFRPSRGRR